MQKAATMEDGSEKHIVTPGRMLPARELLGDMLLEVGKPAEALKEYEASQLREPNRFAASMVRRVQRKQQATETRRSRLQKAASVDKRR